jgi:PAS domain S-box-containing protein
MEYEFRESGIDAIGRVVWGTKLCLIYQKKNELAEILVPFFEAGLTNNEFCFWITSKTPDKTATEKHPKQHSNKLYRYVQEGRIKIIPYREWYFADSGPDSEKALRYREEIYHNSLNQGYEGMRTAFDIDCLSMKDRRSFGNCESKAANAGNKQICLNYCSLSSCDTPELIEHIRSSHYVIAKNASKWDYINRRGSNQVETILEKRIKELRCLFDITSIIGTPGKSLDYRFKAIADLLPRAFLHPERTWARITVHEHYSKTENYGDNDHKITADIIVRGEKAGALEVGYLPSTHSEYSEQFSKEEKLLLEAVAERLGSITEHVESEESIKNNEERFRLITDNSTDLISLISFFPEIHTDYVSPSCLRITGYSQEEFYNDPDLGLNMIHPEDRDKFLELTTSEIVKQEKPVNLRIVRKDGRVIWIEQTHIVITDEHGERQALHLISHEITERVEAEQALQESEQKFSKAFHSSPHIMSITALKDGRFIDVNDSFTSFTGYTREEVIGHRISETGDWMRKEERSKVFHLLEQIGKVRNLEVEAITKSGEVRTGLLSAEVINIGDEPCIIAVLTDITEQKQSQELLKTIYDNSPLGKYILYENLLQYTNPQFQRLVGYSEEELQGIDFLGLVAKEDNDVVKSSMISTKQEACPYPCEYRILNKNGQIKWVLQTITFIHYEGREAILGNLMDITERKYLEKKVIEYEELNKVKSDLLAMVSHELRTPLATIKGYCTMILDYFKKLTSDEKRDYLIAIDHSTDRLAKLVDNLLDTSRMEAGLMKLDRTPTSVTKLIERVASEANVRTDKHHIIVKASKRLPRVSIDAKRIRQVMDNLIDNAIKYSPNGTEITISAQKANQEILISIADQGSGIPLEELTNIFERMYKIEQRLSSGKDGIGLGLYICQRLVEAHAGRIWAESKVGEGSIIHFTLPLPAKKVNPRQT